MGQRSLRIQVYGSQHKKLRWGKICKAHREFREFELCEQELTNFHHVTRGTRESARGGSVRHRGL